MNKLLKTLLISLSITCYDAYSQEEEKGEKWMEYIEELAEESEEDTESVGKLFDDLSFLSENPINLNTAGETQLKQLPFLTDIQITEILDYLKKNGEIVSIYELKNIKYLDTETIELILPFVYVGEIDRDKPFTFKNMLKYGKNELILRYNRTLNEKNGYKDIPDSILQKYPNRKYAGEPFYTSLRYSYNFENRIQAALVAEKDAGEPFLNKGYDYYTAHLLIKDIGMLRSFVLGDYKVAFGQGLILSHDFTALRGSALTQIQRSNNGFRRHYSTNESDFFRGAAATVALGRFDFSAFYSNRHADATVSDGIITSFKTDGLHRTPSEIEKKGNIAVSAFGGNIRYSGANFFLGLSALRYSFGGLTVDPAAAPYNLYYFRGTDNLNMSADYSWRHKNIVFFGETAFSGNGAAATLNAIHWSAPYGIRALLLYRNYSERFHALYGNAFSQNSGLQNEEGLYLSLQCAPGNYWKFSGYADFFFCPWLKYGINTPFAGREYQLQSEYSGIKKLSLALKLRYRRRYKNITSGSETLTEPAEYGRIRLQTTFKPSRSFTLRSVAEINLYDDPVSETSSGWIVAQNVTWKRAKAKLRADIYAAYFYTETYENRVYASEKNMLYVFSVPSFYGEGIRMSAVLRYNFTPSFYVAIKAAWSYYFDRDSIGSDLETIENNDRTDIDLLIRMII